VLASKAATKQNTTSLVSVNDGQVCEKEGNKVPLDSFQAVHLQPKGG
jgi:hypothetical protein